MTSANILTHKQNSNNTQQNNDPSIPQIEASTPDASVWVGASAGSGKTKVLTERVIRLLLPRQNGQSGTAPHKILCLTFTKAAAAEMSVRINKILADWSIIDKDSLRCKLGSLLGNDPTKEQLDEAPKLFAKVIDSAGGLKIMTIHSFCQSILSRFPLEANIPPNFDIISDEQSNNMLIKAKNKILSNNSHNKEISHAINKLAIAINEQQFIEAIEKYIIAKRRKLKEFTQENPDTSLYEKIYKENFGIAEHIKSEQQILSDFCDDNKFDKNQLYNLVKILIKGSATDQKRANNLQKWLESDKNERIKNFDIYKEIYFTKTSTIRKTSKGALSENPECEKIIEKEAERINKTIDLISSLNIAQYSSSLLIIGKAILEEYENMKRTESLLDFDDMIHITLDLLSGKTGNIPNSSAWVMFKLDGGLKHILVDEAQDTNPEQWEIIRLISNEFFENTKENEDDERTLFIVGDEKQSIYSFQGADPNIFYDMKDYFCKKVKNSGRKWKDISMNTSFRSTRSVLELVDDSFNKNNLNIHLGITSPSGKIKHNSFYNFRAGQVEIWPIIEPSKEDKKTKWQLPLEIIEELSPSSILAKNIATTIKSWLDNKEILESKNRPIKPEDIMILVKSRNSLVNNIMRELKNHNIPVSGADRMIISEEISVQDLISVASFSLLPEDDLNLACLLKSPLIDWNDDQLMAIAIDRGTKSLWQSLKETNNQDIIDYLSSLISEASSQHPFEFFNHILSSPCPANKQGSGLQAMQNRLGSDAIDPINEFLNITIDFEQENIPTLQSFLIWNQKSNHVIKRQMDEGENHIRIMTVHGSKGLQSPIVFMPDTIPSANEKIDKFIWPNKSETKLPLWSPLTKMDNNLYKKVKDEIKSDNYSEYVRLMYVAMTRAEDRLYICGYKRKKNNKYEGSWYQLIKNSFLNTDCEEIPPYWDKESSEKILRISCEQTKIDKHENNNKKTEQEEFNIPTWLNSPAPDELEPPRILTPSKAEQEEPPAISPILNNQSEKRFLRGNIIHKLLEILPDINKNDQEKLAKHYVSKPAFGLSKKAQNEIISETLKIINHSDFSMVFGSNSRAEVPITSKIGKDIISGQIDRLVINDKEILIIDYKTNRPSPEKEEDIPAQYIHQLKSYKNALLQIYPDKDIKCALLWTDKPVLMPVTSI